MKLMLARQHQCHQSLGSYLIWTERQQRSEHQSSQVQDQDQASLVAVVVPTAFEL